eukprot:scaffold123427_cov69-Phaeocystis_antarctica.AAC.2
MFHFSRTGQADDAWRSAHDHPCQTAKLARIHFAPSLGELNAWRTCVCVTAGSGMVISFCASTTK